MRDHAQPQDEIHEVEQQADTFGETLLVKADAHFFPELLRDPVDVVFSEAEEVDEIVELEVWGRTLHDEILCCANAAARARPQGGWADRRSQL